jgi:hypothetical protein
MAVKGTSFDEEYMVAQRPYLPQPAVQGHEVDLSYASVPNNELVPVLAVPTATPENHSLGKALFDTPNF